jgi:hypothetical protein
MNKIARSLLLIGLSCWFLAGCVGTDVDDTGQNVEALALAEDADLEQEAFSDGDEDLGAAELEADRDYSTEICSGFSGYGSACQVKCNDNQWRFVGYYPNITNCTASGNALCASVIWQGYGVAHCWN